LAKRFRIHQSHTAHTAKHTPKQPPPTHQHPPGTVEAASLLQKQLDMLQSLLTDPDPHVRVAAVCGVCRVMAVFWEAIPLGVTKAYITR
jgi:hypothetical protein